MTTVPMHTTFLPRVASCLVAVTAMATNGGCATSNIGKDFNDANLSRMEVGRATVDEAKALLGAEPIDVIRTPKGSWAYGWRYIHAPSNGFNTMPTGRM